MEIMTDNTGLVLVMGSSMDRIDRAEAVTRAFLNRSGLENEAFGVCLAMREGMINAVRHGHRFVESKRITFRLRLDPRRLRMEIEDEGDGFDWRRLPAPPASPGSDHGRGLEIIKRYFSRVEYNDKGNVLMLEKRIGS